MFDDDDVFEEEQSIVVSSSKIRPRKFIIVKQIFKGFLVFSVDRSRSIAVKWNVNISNKGK